MPPKRRKGKHSNRGTPTLPEESQVEAENKNSIEEKSDAAEPSTSQPPVVVPAPSLLESPQGKGPRMVLTSDKPRGIYHCDYCHTDISREPRIRCAVCPDFDLCLDCFATTDHTAAIARLKAAATAHDAVAGLDGSIHGSGISSAAANHDDTHGYRVCDSTRFPLFPSTRKLVAPSRQSSFMESRSELGGGDEEKSETVSMSDAEPKSRVPHATNLDEEVPQGDLHPSVASKEKKETTSIASNLDEPPSAKKDDASTVADTEKKEGTVEPASQDPDRETDPTPMDVDSQTEQSEAAESKTVDEDNVETDAENVAVVMKNDDPKFVWTAEEDLRLLDAIKTYGLGNWTEIAEAVSGSGSVGKNARRCMQRYIDDFLGRYGHIFPPYTFAEEDGEVEEDSEMTAEPSEDPLQTSKRGSVLFRSTSSVSGVSSSGRSRKKARIVPTPTLPGYEDAWPDPYLPQKEGIQMGQEVGREQSMRAEQTFVKAVTAAATKEEADQIHEEWKPRLNQPGGPTVLPPRPEDLPSLTGSELAGYMPRRADMDLEWENDAEVVLADMEFSSSDSPQDRELKLQIIEIYNSKLDERERRKNFLLSRSLLNYRQNQQADLKMPRDERDLVRRLRLFERLHTPEEHEQFVADILKAKRLRKEIAKLQMYRRMGITTLEEAEKFELDKNRREYHKMAQLQKEAASESATETSSSALWKQYKSNDRTARRSFGRSDSGPSEPGASQSTITEESKMSGASEKNVVASSLPPDVQVSSSEVPVESRFSDGADDFDITQAPSYGLLSRKEVDLCRRLRLLPQQYLDVKATIIYESMNQGLLDNESAGSSRRAIVKIDSKRKGDVVEFMVRAGWVSPKLSMRT